MFVLKTITTILIAALGLIVFYFLNTAENRESFVGFYVMLLVYVLSVICIWN